MSSRGDLFILSAPSGTGKTSLAHRLLPRVGGMTFSVSHTTRPSRRGEVNGKEYFFVTETEFLRMAEEGQFLEWAQVYGNYYGTSRAFVESRLSEGLDVLLDIDIQGALKVRRLMPDAVTIFVLPPSYRELEERLRGRGLDDEEVIRHRLFVARSEIRHFADYDYLVINRDLDRSTAELEAIVVATRCRLRRRLAAAQEIVDTFLVK
ncbi:MAG: guanylate kinase [Acidobacteriota bacterium]